MENSDVNQQSNTFYSYRKVTKCLSAGISFLTDNFLHIVKVSLPFSLSFAAFTTAIMFILSNSSLLQTIEGGEQASGISQVTLSIILIVLMLLLFVSYLLIYGLMFRLVHIHTHGISIKKYKLLPTLKSSLKYAGKAAVLFVVLFIFALICEFLSTLPFLLGGDGTIFNVIKFGVFAVIVTLTFVLILPFNIALPAMYFEKGKIVKNVIYGYKKGMKVWGKVFCLALLTGILSLLLLLVISMPSFTMLSSYNAETLSQLNGDDVHLPGGFSFWYVIVLFITYYLYTFLFWLETVPFCYLYASIKSDEIEEAKNQLII